MTLLRKLRRFVADRSGLAAIEFALGLPLIALIYLGCVVAYDAHRGYRATLQSSNTVADLVSRLESLDEDGIDAIVSAGEAMLGKYSDDDFWIQITSIENDPDDGLEVRWSEGSAEGEPVTDDDLENYTLPTVPEGESVLLVTTSTSFTPMLLSHPVTVVKTSVRNPRFVSTVDYYSSQ